MSETPELLKGCPFCGSAPKVQRSGTKGHMVYCDSHECPAQPDIECVDTDKLAPLWNRRAPDPRVSALIEAAEAAKSVMLVYVPKHEGLYPNGDYEAVENLSAALRAALRTQKDEENE